MAPWPFLWQTGLFETLLWSFKTTKTERFSGTLQLQPCTLTQHHTLVSNGLAVHYTAPAEGPYTGSVFNKYLKQHNFLEV